MTGVRTKAKSPACRRGHNRQRHSKTYPSGTTLCTQCEADRKSGAVVGRAEITSCARGHDFTEENTYLRPNGQRGCRECRKSYSSIYPKKPQKRTREQWLWKAYKITQADYDALLEKQNGVCAICRQPETIKDRPLRVDHNHDTGEVRGLLCHHCNVVLGHVHDDPKILLAMIDYLEEVK